MNVRYEISDGVNPIRKVKPFVGPDVSVTWEKEDAPKFDFKKELKEITLLKEDFKYFHALETSLDRCDVQTLSVVLECGNDELILFTGDFTMSKGVWDLDKCTVKFKITNEDPYKCIKDNDEDVNILLFGTPQNVNLGATYQLEYYLCFSKDVFGDKCEQSFLDDGLWTFVFEEKAGATKAYARYHVRRKITVDCDFVLTDGWIEIESCSSGKKTYASKIDSDSIQALSNLFTAEGEDEYDKYFAPFDTIDNGRKLQDTMQFLLQIACNGMVLKSDFFQWNPDVVSGINYVTNEPNKLLNLIIFQKSDVKRASVSNNATKAMTNFKDIIEQVCSIFNCRYQIKDNVLRIEHLSYFERDFGLNLMNAKNKQLLKGTRKYSYDETKLPKYEKFEFMEAGSKDFVGVPIEYTNNCVNNDEENRTTVTIDDITTDVMYCIENPDPDGEVSDDGFVIVACDAFNNILHEDGILDGDTTINNTLSWAHLQRDYWKHGRIFMSGLMNETPTQFLSIIPTIKQDRFSAKLDCDEIRFFDPIDQIKATLGWGFVQSAEFKLSKCIMSFELYLDDIQQATIDENYGDFDSNFSEDFD